jgi:hypothetical protein
VRLTPDNIDLVLWSDKLPFRTRAIIESIIDSVKNTSPIQHTHHRSLVNFVTHLLTGLLAYCFQPKNLDCCQYSIRQLRDESR